MHQGGGLSHGPPLIIRQINDMKITRLSPFFLNDSTIHAKESFSPITTSLSQLHVVN